MKRFILLLNHDDISLSAYLQHCMDRGEQFIKASGNVFTFKKKAPEGKRIAAVTYLNTDPDLKMKFQIEDYAALMKKRGWRLISTGVPEDIFDSRRHVFLETDQPDAEFPVTNPETAEKARKREVRSCIRCAAMLLLLLGFAIFFIHHDPDVILSSTHILVLCTAAFACWVTSAILTGVGCSVLKRKTQLADGFRNFLAVDRAVLFCLLTVFCLLASFLIDMFQYPDRSHAIVWGEKRVTVYRDEVPLKLEDVDLPAAGTFRSSRKTERGSFLMRSLVCSDQSFSDPDRVTDLSMISYTLYESSWEGGLDWVVSQKGYGRYPVADELKETWHSEEVRSDGHHRLIARYPGAVLVFTTLSELDGIDPEPILEKLLPGY